MSQGRCRGLVIGCGYLGHRVARSWRDCGWDVAALTRSVERAADLERSGLAVCVGDVTDLDSLATLPSADVV
ncbi:MAG: NAD-binding protein, partial [Planctomycetota bacterium]|nr:NAD-binding protein [Planctomycetota bacterium]